MAGPATQTFYQQQAHNRRQSIALVVILCAILGLFASLVSVAVSGSVSAIAFALPLAIGLALLLSAGAWFGGDGLVLAASQAREVNDTDQPQLLNVVRELSVAANIPMPKVYVINDSAPNAFATGRDPKHASVAITSGLLEKLDREELQGVLGHELSHVRNYDTRFTLLVAVLVGSIALLADFFLRFSFWGGGSRRSRGSNDQSAGLAVIIMVVAIVAAILAPFFARLVQLAVSRQREYLADASSVELTRNPVGLERALASIAADQEPLEVANRATQHLYIVNPLKKLGGGSSNLFSTHPPIVDRISRLRALTGEAPLDAAAASSLTGLD
jgi:heat shock protein HtpX